MTITLQVHEFFISLTCGVAAVVSPYGCFTLSCTHTDDLPARIRQAANDAPLTEAHIALLADAITRMTEEQ